MNKEIRMKDAFACMGIHDMELRRRPFKEMDEEMVVACLINWMMNSMPNNRKFRLRVKAADEVYQITISKYCRYLRVETIVKLTKEKNNEVLYDWDEETTYDNLAIEKIEAAMERANVERRQTEPEGNHVQEWLNEPIKFE